MSVMLFPRPREVVALGGVCVKAETIAAEAGVGLPPQGYDLQVDATGAHLRYADGAGRRYGLATWEQLQRAHPDGVPPQKIRDWPDFPTRGFMLDISRDRVPTRQTLERLVDLLTLGRINHFELYTEHTFAYRDHRAVWAEASPMTAEDLVWLDKLCAERGIELSANQNCFGHMERWLKHPEYRPRAECPDGWTSKLGNQMPPAVLAPTPVNADFAVGLVRELIGHVRSRRVNIGCDETFELGKCTSASMVAERGRETVYLEHLQRLIEPLHRDGCEVMFWGDILRSHPEAVRQLPRDNTLALVWHYEAPIDPEVVPPVLLQVGGEFGITADVLRGFRTQVAAFAESAFPHWVCPGTSSWNSFVGRWSNARANMLDAAAAGLESGATGYMITDWGDNGHLQPPSVSFGPLLYGAGVSWCRASNDNEAIEAVLDQLVFKDEAGELGAALETAGELYGETGKVGFNGSPLFTAVVRRGLLGSLGVADPAALEQLLANLENASAAIDRAHPTVADGPIVRRELQQALRLARHGAWRLAGEIDMPGRNAQALDRELPELIEEQRACWLLRSRAGGLADSLDRLKI